MKYPVNLVPQRFRLLGTVKETTMLGMKSPKKHAKYRVGDQILFKEYYVAKGEWGDEYGQHREQLFEVVKILPAERFRDRSRHISFEQVTLHLKRIDDFKLTDDELKSLQPKENVEPEKKEGDE